MNVRWMSVIIEAAMCSAMLFAAHALPLNGNVIEPAMAAGKRWAYPAGFVFYAVALMFPVLFARRFLRDV